MKNNTRKQEMENLDNKIVFLSSVIIIYAILLLFIQKMAETGATAAGALAFIQILRWTALGGAMACAAWSAYKEKFGFFMYCGVCLYIFLSTTILLYCGNHGKAYLINYISLVLAFVFNQVYSILKKKNLFEKKFVKIGFLAACGLAVLAVAAVSIAQVLY
ncbi:MAG: hypothetical protein IKA17_01675 [Clostridia bacterium]|nr:hypothetical protein [Clostridia bacterium]